MDPITLIGAGVGAAAAVVAAPVVLTAAGFTAGGIAAGSVASSLMSAAAVANGGGIAAGSVVATLQAVSGVGLFIQEGKYTNPSTEFMSLGAAGIPLAGQAIVGTLGAVVGAATSMASNCTV